jgi:hypothetical protein
MIAEWIISLMTFIIGVVFFITTFSFPNVYTDPGGFSLFPRILSVGIVVASALLIAKLFKNRKNQPNTPVDFVKTFLKSWSKDSTSEISGNIRRLTYVFIISIAYPWFIVRIGFMLATLLYVGILMRLFKTNIITCFVLAGLVAFGLHLFFVQVLQAYVPEGAWLESVVEYFTD